MSDQILRIIICGGRYFEDKNILFFEVDKFIRDKIIELELDAPNVDIEIIHGGQRTWIKEKRIYIGADFFAERYAVSRMTELKVFKANWELHGKKAGPIRNSEMAEYGAANLPCYCLAFWDKISKGTADMMNKAKEKGITVKEINY